MVCQFLRDVGQKFGLQRQKTTNILWRQLKSKLAQIVFFRKRKNDLAYEGKYFLKEDRKAPLLLDFYMILLIPYQFGTLMNGGYKNKDGTWGSIGEFDKAFVSHSFYSPSLIGSTARQHSLLCRDYYIIARK